MRAREGIYSLTYDGRQTPEKSWRELSSLKNTGIRHDQRSSAEPRACAIWVLGDDGIVIRIVDGTTDRWDLRTLMSGDVTVSIAECPDGSIWVGGQGSLFVYRDDECALMRNRIFLMVVPRISVLTTSDDTIWIASEQSDVYRVDYFSKRWRTLEDLNLVPRRRTGDCGS